MGKRPKEWTKCPEMCSEAVCGRFVAFKTPYEEIHNSHLQDNFNVSKVFELAEERDMKMGLWFDLTHVDRYYDGREVEKYNCVYVKLKCSGRDMKEANLLLREFKRQCNEFFANHPGLLVGVHCTHGFNRTGYFIVSYMVDELGWDVLEAVNEFARVRPPGIYRLNKLNELSRKYHVVLRVPREHIPWAKDNAKRRGFDVGKRRNTEDNKTGSTETNQEERLSWRTTSSAPRHFTKMLKVKH